MARFVFYEAHLCSYYMSLIKYNREQRSTIKNDRTLAAINMNLILCTACFLEGILEDRGNLLLGYYNSVHNCVDVENCELRKSFNTIHHNISYYYHHKISQNTGLDSYDTTYRIFLNKSFKLDENIKPLVEGVNVLFQLRNVIAHGRQGYAYEVEAHYTDGIEEHFMGGYKKAEEYLIKKMLLNTTFVEAENLDIYFTNEISDHFYNLVCDFIKELDKFIDKNLIITDILKEKLDKYNNKYKTNCSMREYFRMNGIAMTKL